MSTTAAAGPGAASMQATTTAIATPTAAARGDPRRIPTRSRGARVLVRRYVARLRRRRAIRMVEQAIARVPRWDHVAAVARRNDVDAVHALLHGLHSDAFLTCPRDLILGAARAHALDVVLYFLNLHECFAAHAGRQPLIVQSGVFQFGGDVLQAWVCCNDAAPPDSDTSAFVSLWEHRPLLWRQFEAEYTEDVARARESAAALAAATDPPLAPPEDGVASFVVKEEDVRECDVSAEQAAAEDDALEGDADSDPDADAGAAQSTESPPVACTSVALPVQRTGGPGDVVVSDILACIAGRGRVDLLDWFTREFPMYPGSGMMFLRAIEGHAMGVLEYLRAHRSERPPADTVERVLDTHADDEACAALLSWFFTNYPSLMCYAVLERVVRRGLRDLAEFILSNSSTPVTRELLRVAVRMRRRDISDMLMTFWSTRSMHASMERLGFVRKRMTRVG